MSLKTKKTMQLYLAIFGLVGVLAFSALQLGDPLLPASDLTVTYEVDGRTFHDATVYQPVLGDEGRYYVQLPGADQQWWVVDMATKSITVRQDGESYYVPRAIAAEPGAERTVDGGFEWGVSKRVAWINGVGFSCTLRQGGNI